MKYLFKSTETWTVYWRGQTIFIKNFYKCQGVNDQMKWVMKWNALAKCQRETKCQIIKYEI